MKTTTEQAYAKLNLTLDILRKREDGYHDLSMVMQSITLCDTLHFSAAEEDSTEISCQCDADLPTDGGNLAVRAAEQFFARVPVARQGLRITIEKHIPMQAGMAGGSSDAAAVLRALRRLLCPTLPWAQLAAIAAEVGSDVPFCLRGGTAIAEGRGERLTHFTPAEPLYYAVCKPPLSLSTPKMFSRVQIDALRNRPDAAALRRALEEGEPTAAIACRLGNVFEQALTREESEVIETVKSALCSCGAYRALMTGSGSAVFGIFHTPEQAKAAVSHLRRSYPQSFFAQSQCEQGAE